MSSLRVRYQTYELGAADIHVRALRDKQQYSDENGVAAGFGISPASWPLFGVVWASGELLAQLMQYHDIGGKRILEVGCGIGLASLLLNHRMADITATDQNPEAGSFLLENVKLNKGRPIPFIRTGWADENDELGRFNLIIGSDLLYEPDHASLLSEFIGRHAGSQCDVIIIDPGRGIHPKFSDKMSNIGFSQSMQIPDGVDHQGKPFRGKILYYTR